MRSRDIELLLPQRDPFLFVDELLSAESREITGVMTYDAAFPYYQEYLPGKMIVPATLLIEALVQCGGAGVKKLGITGSELWGVAALEKVRFFDAVSPDSTVRMVVQNHKLSSRLIKQTGESFCDGRRILRATWICLKLNAALR